MPKQPFGRPDRTLDSRETDTREYEYRPMAALPDATPQDGYVFKWCRLATLTEPDARNVAENIHDGWEPVTAQEQPGVARLLRLPSEATTIETGGLQLCKNTLERFNKRNEFYENRARILNRDVRTKFASEAGEIPAMPLLAPDHRSSVTTGRKTEFGSGE